MNFELTIEFEWHKFKLKCSNEQVLDKLKDYHYILTSKVGLNSWVLHKVHVGQHSITPIV